ncbi:unnamed protein product [Effrenium voratum]|uniref:Uncharacterized protein n=1 Tax=Effrenium voratum TaxID=2562239 RepID=A0AA36J0A3_9DINO|nr:unnamed protein product [Effrenium voratum]
MRSAGLSREGPAAVAKAAMHQQGAELCHGRYAVGRASNGASPANSRRNSLDASASLSKAPSDLSPSLSLKSLSRVSRTSTAQSAGAARASLFNLVTKCRYAQKHLCTELSALRGVSCEVDARLAQQLKRLAPYEVSRTEMESTLQLLQEQTTKCRMVKEHMSSLVDAAMQALECDEYLQDPKPATAPPYALQLQRQLAAKLQESRVLCRDCAQLGLDCLRRTELREDLAMGQYFPATAAAAATSAAVAMVEKLRLEEPELPSRQDPSWLPQQVGAKPGFGQGYWPDCTIQEEEEDRLSHRSPAVLCS